MDRIYLAMPDRLEIRTRRNGDWSTDIVEPGEHLECVAVTSARSERVLCGSFEDGLLRSIDGGATFEHVGDAVIGDDAVTSLAIDPSDPDVLLAGTEPSGLYRSSDGGQTWSSVGGVTDVSSVDEWSFPPRPDTHHVRWIAIAPRTPDRWYVGIEAGTFLVTPDGGESWIDRPEGSRRDNHWLATHPHAPDRVYAAAGDGYAESRDGGSTWSHPQEGLDHRYVWSVAVDPGDPDVRYVSAARDARRAHRSASAEAYLYRRVGKTPWERLDDLPVGEGVVRPVLASGDAPGTIYAASNRGMFISRDGGDQWDAVPGSWPERYLDQVPRGIAITEA